MTVTVKFNDEWSRFANTRDLRVGGGDIGNMNKRCVIDVTYSDGETSDASGLVSVNLRTLLNSKMRVISSANIMVDDGSNGYVSPYQPSGKQIDDFQLQHLESKGLGAGGVPASPLAGELNDTTYTLEIFAY